MDRSEVLKKEYRMTALISAAMASSPILYYFIARMVTPSIQTPPETLTLLRLAMYAGALSLLPAAFFVKSALLKKQPQDNFLTLVKKLKNAAPPVLAICETPAVFGLILFFLGGSFRDFLILALFSGCLFAVFFPRFDQWEEYVQGAL